MPGNDLDIGIHARLNSTGFVAVDLGMGADPVAFTPEVVEAEKRRLGCKQLPDGTWKLSWRFRKEYLRDAEAQIGKPVFEPDWLDAQNRHIRNPAYRMDLDESGKLVKRERGRLKVWLEPDTPPEKIPSGLRGAIRSCALGCDVGEGVSQSDSTIEVFFADNREQAAEFACNEITPTDLGRFAGAVAKRYNNGLILPVRKMHGITVIRSLIDNADYTFLWFDRKHDTMAELRAQHLGWLRGETSDEFLFGGWVDAIHKERAIIHSLTLQQQMTQYIYDKLGRITHQALAEMPREVRERHGDLVIGASLAYQACLDLPRFEKTFKDAGNPPGSFGWRQAQARRRRERAQKGDGW